MKLHHLYATIISRRWYSASSKNPRCFFDMEANGDKLGRWGVSTPLDDYACKNSRAKGLNEESRKQHLSIL